MTKPCSKLRDVEHGLYTVCPWCRRCGCFHHLPTCPVDRKADAPSR